MAAKEIKNEGILTGCDNTKITYSSFVPSKTEMQLLIIHGYSEHMRNYFETAEELSKNAVATHILDLPGHGLSDGPRGHIDDFQLFLDAVELLLKKNPHHLKTKPIFMLGHSMGGLIATLYCLQRKPKIKGLILSSPLAGFALTHLIPVWAISKALMWKNPRLRMPKPSHPAALSRNPQKWEMYACDPYRLQTITPSLFLAIVNAARTLRRQIRLLEPPLLVFYAAQDHVVSAEATRRVYSAAGSKDKTMIAFSEARHELFQEEEKPQIIEKMLAWMKDRS